MSAEERTLRAIELTRAVLAGALCNVYLLSFMAANDIGPEDVEDMITEILEYLDKTKEEKKPHG